MYCHFVAEKRRTNFIFGRFLAAWGDDFHILTGRTSIAASLPGNGSNSAAGKGEDFDADVN